MILPRFLVLSAVLHLLMVLISALRFQDSKDEPIIKKNSSNFSVRFQKQPTLTNGREKKETSSEIETNQDTAFVRVEVQAIQNSIQYPQDALEQGLESDCEWRIIVGEFGKYQKLELTRPCLYKIFEEEVKNAIKNWKFSSPPGTVMELPIRFRIIKE